MFPVSDTQAYKMLGNGWTVDVIAHILHYAPGITKESLEVLSMYDGMSCGHLALDKLGAHMEEDQAKDQPPEETEPEDVPEPYVIVRIPGGELPDQDTRQQVEIVLVVCVYDPDPGRQGFRDALHIVNTILTHYGANGIVGRRYEVQYLIKWVTQEEDTHPYYFAGMALKLAAPAIFKDVPET